MHSCSGLGMGLLHVGARQQPGWCQGRTSFKTEGGIRTHISSSLEGLEDPPVATGVRFGKVSGESSRTLSRLASFANRNRRSAGSRASRKRDSGLNAPPRRLGARCADHDAAGLLMALVANVTLRK